MGGGLYRLCLQCITKYCTWWYNRNFTGELGHVKNLGDKNYSLDTDSWLRKSELYVPRACARLTMRIENAIESVNCLFYIVGRFSTMAMLFHGTSTNRQTVCIRSVAEITTSVVTKSFSQRTMKCSFFRDKKRSLLTPYPNWSTTVQKRDSGPIEHNKCILH